MTAGAQGAGARDIDGSEDFTAFVARHESAVKHTACAMVGIGASEDIAQESFLRVWRVWPTLQDDGERAYGVLMATTRNCARNHLRAHATSRTRPTADVELLLAASAPSPADVVVADEWWSAVRAGVRDLQAEALLLGPPPEGLSEEALRQRRRRARMRLRKRLHAAGLTASPAAVVWVRKAWQRLDPRGTLPIAAQAVAVASVVALGTLMLPAYETRLAIGAGESAWQAPLAAPGDELRSRAPRVPNGDITRRAAPPSSGQRRAPGRATAYGRRPPVHTDLAVCGLGPVCVGEAQRGDDVCVRPVQDSPPVCAKQNIVPVCPVVPTTAYTWCRPDPQRTGGLVAPPA